MKQKVKFSLSSILLTALILILFVEGTIMLLDNEVKLTLFCIIMGGVTIAGLYYCPISIEANEVGIKFHCLLSPPKTFRYDTIQSVDTCYPSIGGLRLCASGGYFGFWGYFRDFVIGTYIGYYGSRNNCIVVKLKSGKQYVLGCDNPVDMVDYIKSQLCKCIP